MYLTLSAVTRPGIVATASKTKSDFKYLIMIYLCFITT